MSKKRGGKVSKKELQSLFGLYKRYVAPRKWSFIIGFFFLICTSSTVLIFPRMIGGMIDNVDKASTTSFGVGSHVQMVIVALLALGVFSFFRIVLFAKVSEHGMAQMRNDLFKKVIALPVHFFEQKRVGDISTRITTDVALLKDTLSTTSAELFRQIIVLVGGIVFLFLTSVDLTLVMLASFPLLIGIAIIIGKKVKAISKETQENLGDANVVVEEVLHGIDVVKAFTNEPYESKRFASRVDKVLYTALSAAKFRGLLASFIISGIFGAILLVMWRGAVLVNEGEITNGDMISFVVYTLIIGASVAGIGDLMGQLSKAAGASDRVTEILNEQNELDIYTDEKVEIAGNVEVKNLSFAYPMRKDVQVLKDVSFSIQEGRQIAFVGQSGSGKSTIIKLLLQLYNDYQGSISVGGKDLKSLDKIAFRKHIGLVPQEVMLFGDSIKENILYGNPNATMEQVIQAAKEANALSFIESFPEGFDTIVGERGVQLSGGQRQRIAIARTILKNPTILILDEATSSLDAESEHLVQEALSRLMEGRTTIVIAHRLATIQGVDEICVLKEGEIVEHGKHNDLLTIEDGYYRRLCEMQFQMN